MLKVRVIPTLLTDGYGLVKGERFQSWRTVGSVMPAIRVFNHRDVDELLLLDVTARSEKRSCDTSLVQDAAAEVRVPLTVGGGVSSLDDIESLLAAGADKVVLNSAALESPGLVNEGARRFGSQCIVVSIDVISLGGQFACVSHSGTRQQTTGPVAWARECVDRGAGEIVVTRVEHDGTLQGYDLQLIAELSAAVTTPIVAAGGAGCYDDFVSAVQAGASAVAAGAVFQFTEATPAEARRYMSDRGIPVRSALMNAGVVGS